MAWQVCAGITLLATAVRFRGMPLNIATRKVRIMTRQRLTPHQRDVLATLVRRSLIADRSRYRWVHSSDVGAPAALEHLVRKGWAHRKTERGPRGGEHHYYMPVGRGAAHESEES